MKSIFKNKIGPARKALLVAAAGATLGVISAGSAIADIAIDFSKAAENENMTQVDINFDFDGMAPGETVGIDFTSDQLVAVHVAENEGSPRSLCIKGGSKDNSKKVVYLETGGKKTGEEFFKKFTLSKADNLNTHFSWFVGDGYFAIDETILDMKKFAGTFYINVPISDLIEADVLGKKIVNGKVTISSTDGVAKK